MRHPRGHFARSMPWYAAAMAACLLGMGTKEVMATAPLIVLLYDRTFLAGSFREAWRRRSGLYLALAASWGVVAALLISTGFHGGTTGFSVQKFTWWSYLLTQPGVIVHYFRLAFWPPGLCFDYSWPPAHTDCAIVLLPGIVVGSLLALTVWALAKRPAWGFLGAWFFVILAPVSSFVPIKDAAFEHRMYLPLAAVVVGVVIGAWVGRPVACRLWDDSAIGVMDCGRCDGRVCVGRTRNPHVPTQCRLPQPRIHLEGHGIQGPEQRAGPLQPGQHADQHRKGRRSLYRIPKNSGNQPRPRVGPQQRRFVLARRKQFDEAMTHYRKALEIKPDFAEAHYNLGLLLTKHDRTDDAIEQFSQALAVNPEYAEAHDNLGIVLFRRGQYDEALLQFRRAVELKPDDAGVHHNLGIALARCGRIDEAIPCFRRALAIDPDYADARKNLDLALGRRQKTE